MTTLSREDITSGLLDEMVRFEALVRSLSDDD